MYETFWLEPTDRERRWLRRFADGGCPAMPGDYSYHNAKVQVEDGPRDSYEENGHTYDRSRSPGDPQFCTDPRWLEVAGCACGYEFTAADKFQILTRGIWRRIDTGEEMTIEDAPTGALWNADWMGEYARGNDGLHVMCKLPGGHDWTVDGRASNCDQRDRPHHCWVRHGTFGDRLTVDKNGDTCGAGGGSIWVHHPAEWHGFLRDGRLLEVGET